VVDSKRELDELRQELARLDAQLLVALDKRARTARRVGELRHDQAPSLPLADHAAIRALVARSSGDLPHEVLTGIFHAIFAACLSLELPVKVAFVGPEGGPGHAAARSRFGQDSNLVGAETPEGALEEVSRKRAEFAVAPIETATAGPVQPTIFALMTSDLRIVEVLDGSFDLHLMNRTGNLADVEKIYATSADRASCERFLGPLAPRVSVLDVKAPLMACQLAAEDHGAAALASEAFGAQLGLEIARRSVLDGAGPRVRYAVVGTRPSRRTRDDLTSLAFTLPEASGSLLDVLKVFIDRGIRLTKIHSHPVQGGTWTYLFHIEIVGHFTDRSLVTAFEEMKRVTRSFKLLGSYPTP
jgi:chorismate mutase/prephenate dehydratase